MKLLTRDKLKPRTRTRVLVADDDPQVRSSFAELLREKGYDVETVATGLEAFAATLEGRYAIVFMDDQMPSLDGCEATRLIREREAGSRSHVVIVSFSGASDRERFLASGMDDCLPKPPTRADLERVLRRWGRAEERGSVSHEAHQLEVTEEE